MADDGASTSTATAPVTVEYDPITSVPAEFNEFLPPDSAEFKRWKASQEGPEAIEKLTLKDNAGNEIEKKLPGGKVKKKQKASIIVETNTRNKKKCTTSVTGLDLFGVKLSEASKVFGKKFACGCSVVKTADGKEQIDMQGDFLATLPDVIVKNFASKGVTMDDISLVDNVAAKKGAAEEED